MRKLQSKIFPFLLCLLSGCSLFISDEQKSEITKAVIEARIDSAYASYERQGSPEEYRRVVLLQGKFVNKQIASSIEKNIKFPFTALRTDSTEIEVIKGTAQNKNGKTFEFVKESNDKKTGVPIFTMIVDSLEILSPYRVSVNVYEADNKSVHYQGAKWWLNWKNEMWQPDSMQILWTN